jgi:hypothetical protein
MSSPQNTSESDAKETKAHEPEKSQNQVQQSRVILKEGTFECLGQVWFTISRGDMSSMSINPTYRLA